MKEGHLPLLEVENLKQYYPIRGGLLGKVVNHVKAVDGVSFTIYPGETLGVVGESGCGKSTTGRSILRLEEPTEGSVVFRGDNILNYSKEQMRKIRKEMQIIFQDPFASLNPRRTVGQTIEEALEISNVVPPEDRRVRALQVMEQVGLRPDQIDRYPHEFSGGQRQRICIARALAVEPSLIVCDEAVSALDVSIQAQVLNLLKDLQQQYDLTYLFISHDLGVVHYITDRVMVMYLGKVVELSNTAELFDTPYHPYTKALLSAIPSLDPDEKKERIILQGDVPSPIDPPTGCRFHTRCPIAVERCKLEEPLLRELSPAHHVACHLAEKE
ncbi:MAG: dipeptide ABC transporter ATP-binding protein [Negativicutes bacterium]|nr:dipeptide ABC transporter ATP-binding protein [Negativicutes bacterium]